ncbi:MAG: hypothetical protein IOD12_00065 [Silvanigrellales bacterium]|nr:hypothetical protein [Silvanigrellales bacterium]
MMSEKPDNGITKTHKISRVGLLALTLLCVLGGFFLWNKHPDFLALSLNERNKTNSDKGSKLFEGQKSAERIETAPRELVPLLANEHRDFDDEVTDFASAPREFMIVTLAENWMARKETRALPVLALRLNNDLEKSADDRLGPSARGVFLQALGTLGRASQDTNHRQQAFETLSARVELAAKKPTAQNLGDGLIACESLVELGFRGNTSLLFSILVDESKTMPWPLGERILLVLEALGAPEKKDAAKVLSGYLRTPPNPQFSFLSGEEKERLSSLVARFSSGP